jgi:L-cysteine S-thiosulfotransferase
MSSAMRRATKVRVLRLGLLTTLGVLSVLGVLTTGCALNEPPAAPTGVSASAPASSRDPRQSGFELMSARLQAMQTDDLQNPGMLWVADGQALWDSAPPPIPADPAGHTARSCSGCHGPGAQSMRGVATRYPDVDAISQRVITLAQRIDTCRTRHQQREPFAPESKERLSLEAYVANASRGLPVAPSTALAVAQARTRGEALFERRIGQLNLSCMQCHTQFAGRRLAGSPIPQAHPTGYPIYRLEWQGMGSLQRRLRTCLTGVRAELYPFNAPELVDLEAYLAGRAAGMRLETPAVRP